MVRAMAILGALAASLTCLGAGKLEVDQPVYDFGEVVAGYVVQHAFLLTNVGDDELHFTRPPAASCGCSYATLPVAELSPGESVELVVFLDTSDFGGRGIAKWVYVYTDAPGAERVKLVLRGYVREAAPYQGSASALYWRWYLLIDLRTGGEYRAGHLLGAVNAPLSHLREALSPLPRDIPLYLYDEDGTDLLQAMDVCDDLGFSAVRGLSGGAAGWVSQLGTLFWIGEAPEGQPLVTEGPLLIPPRQLAREYVLVLDLRPEADYVAGHLPGALHLPPDEVEAFAETLPRPREGARLSLWCVDEDGGLSCRVAKRLRELGFPDAKCIIGGLAQWRLLFGEWLLIPQGEFF